MQFIRFMRAKQKKNMNKIEKTWKEANKNKERKITDRETESQSQTGKHRRCQDRLPDVVLVNPAHRNQTAGTSRGKEM